MPSKQEIAQRCKRAEDVNTLLRFIGDHGRHFFRSDKRNELGEYLYDQIQVGETGRLTYVTWRGRSLSLHGQDYYFSNNPHTGLGGTLSKLVLALKKHYVMRGDAIQFQLGPFPDWACEGDPWGYGEDMEKVRAKAIDLGVYKILTKGS